MSGSTNEGVPQGSSKLGIIFVQNIVFTLNHIKSHNCWEKPREKYILVQEVYDNTF